jgi:hypothetical protein
MVRDGIIFVHNPDNITSFWNAGRLPNRSLQAQNYASSIHRALEYQRDYTGQTTQWFPNLMIHLVTE